MVVKCKVCGKEMEEPIAKVMFGMEQKTECINPKCPNSKVWLLNQTDGDYPVSPEDLKIRKEEAILKLKR